MKNILIVEKINKFKELLKEVWKQIRIGVYVLPEVVAALALVGCAEARADTTTEKDPIEQIQITDIPKIESTYTPEPTTILTPFPESTPKQTLSPEEVDFGLSQEAAEKTYNVEDILFVDLLINDKNVYVLATEEPSEDKKITIKYLFNQEIDLFTVDSMEFSNFFNDPSSNITFEFNSEDLKENDVKVLGCTNLVALLAYLVDNDKPGKAEAVNPEIIGFGTTLTAKRLEDWYRASFYRENWFVPGEYSNELSDKQK